MGKPRRNHNKKHNKRCNKVPENSNDANKNKDSNEIVAPVEDQYPESSDALRTNLQTYFYNAGINIAKQGFVDAKNKKQTCKTDILNDDCLDYIFKYLSLAERTKIKRVCKHWKKVLDSSEKLMTKLDLNSEYTLVKHTFYMNRVNDSFVDLTKWELINETILIEIFRKYGNYFTEVDLYTIDKRKSKEFKNRINLVDICSPAVVRALSVYCTNLKKVYLSWTDDDIDKEVKYLFFQNSGIQTFLLNSEMKGECLLSLPSNTLEELILTNCLNIESKYLAEAISKLKRLKILQLKYLNMDAKTAKAIANCSTLKSLSFRYGSVEAFSKLNSIGTLNKLEEISFRDLKPFKNDTLKLIGKLCVGLKKVEIIDCNYVTDDGIKALSLLPKLETLILVGQVDVTDNSIKSFSTLKEFHCKFCLAINYEGLCSMIKSCKNLQKLDITGCEGIMNDFIDLAFELVKKKNKILKINALRTGIFKKYIDQNVMDDSSPLKIYFVEKFNLL